MMKRHATTAALAALFVAAALSGCESEPSDQRIGDIDSVEADEPQNHAATRRLTIDQLEGAIPVVAGANAGGPIEWRLLNGQGVPTITALDDDVLGGTMGRPDYEYVTEEPASPDALYVKFSDDMARNVCHQMVEADVMRAAGEERVLTRFAAIDSTSDSQAIDDNISYLLLRFLGQHTGDDDDAVSELRVVFDAGVNGAPAGSTPAAEGWRAVCVALFTSPAFHIY